MRKFVSFSSYNKIRKLSFNEFNRWITNLYTIAFEEGQKEQLKVTNTISFEEELPKILLTVRGLGQKRVDTIMQAIDDYYKKKAGNDGTEIK